MGPEIINAPARPFAVEFLALLAFARGRIDAQVELGHTLDHLHADAAHRDLVAVMHVVEHQHHATGGQAA